MPRVLATLLGCFGLISSAAAADLAPGDRAPAFTLAGSDGREYRLSDFVGKQGLVLAWFPKAFTAG
jgi:peroxiredoxin Q/BCP